MASISQREARALKRRVRQLEEAERTRRRVWAEDHMYGTPHLMTFTAHDELFTTVKTARKLGHAVVLVLMWNDGTKVRVFGLPVTSEPV